MQHKQFESFFLAETFLEKLGFVCKKEVWIHSDSSRATVVALSNGVHVQFQK